MYFSLKQLNKSHDNLGQVHSFFFVTFLTCKLNRLPIGKEAHFPIDKKETEFLQKFFKPDLSSTEFYRISRIGGKIRKWFNEDYPSSGSQKTRTTTFKDVFVHKKNTDLWAWSNNYINILERILRENNYNKIPAFDLAVWLYRNHNWSLKTTPKKIVELFYKDFYITEEESNELFTPAIPTDFKQTKLFQDKNISFKELQTITGRPSDAKPDEGGALTLLELLGVGPAKKLKLLPADRINLITGDNGLGKTFLLECAWWALSGRWAALPVYPREDAKRNEPRISYEICSEGSRGEKKTANYHWETNSWLSKSEKRPTIPGLIIYARIDGSFAVWDPAKAISVQKKNTNNENSEALIFSSHEIWHGLESKKQPKGRVLCNGIIRDWVNWQNNPSTGVFDVFCSVLEKLSPEDLGVLEPGPPTRLPDDARDIPTIKHSYGVIPLLHASAGVKRIIAIAYLLVWAWNEHITQSQLMKKPVQRKMVVLIDEIEAHLHPKWQRLILPALEAVCNELDDELKTQLIIATHSPLVTASLEPIFNKDCDKLFHLDMIEDHQNMFSQKVILESIPFVKMGRMDRWLTSDAFELNHAYSIEAESAIKEAIELQESDNPDKDQIKKMSEKLMKHLPSEDTFWPRWICYAEKYGVDI